MKKLILLSIVLIVGCDKNGNKKNQWEYCTLSAVYMTTMGGWWIYDLHGGCKNDITSDKLNDLGRKEGAVGILQQLGKKGWEFINKDKNEDKSNTVVGKSIIYEFKRGKS
tara:strand:- start:512 stop:841 length:330 start_codon:yes stop_codon:yes gene_type:complete